MPYRPNLSSLIIIFTKKLNIYLYQLKFKKQYNDYLLSFIKSCSSKSAASPGVINP